MATIIYLFKENNEFMLLTQTHCKTLKFSFEYSCYAFVGLIRQLYGGMSSLSKHDNTIT